MPCSEKRAKLLLSRGRARVHRVLPFVIHLTDRSLESCALQPLVMKMMRSKQVYGFQTGDLVRAIVDDGKKQGVYVGRVAVRKEGSFNIQTKDGVVQGIWHKRCTLVQRSDGYGYHVMARVYQQPVQA